MVQSLDTGGLENGVVNLANRIDKSRFNLDILCLRYTGRLRDRLSADVSVEFDPTTASSVAKACRVIADCVNNGSYDVVHTHGWATLLPGFVGGRILGRAIVVNGEHGTFFADSFRRRLLQKLLFRAVATNCTVSDSLRLEMQLLFSVPESQAETIVNGVDVDRFKPDQVARRTVRRAKSSASCR